MKRIDKKLRPAGLDPMHLSIDEAAAVLTRAGGEAIVAADIERDLAAGAPRNDDGTVNLVHYTAWMMRGAGGGS